MTEKEILKEHNDAASQGIRSAYQFFYPLLEFGECLHRMLKANRALFHLKEAEKNAPAPIVQGAKRGGTPPPEEPATEPPEAA